MNRFFEYLKQVALTIDQAVNVIILGGMADETISARCYRMRNSGVFWSGFHKFVDVLLWFQPSHCEKAFIAEVERLDSPIQERAWWSSTSNE